ncbi:MAG: DUF1801 domain-containing protein [Salaquimonas sp.]
MVNHIEIPNDPIEQVVGIYPKPIAEALQNLRDLIVTVGQETPSVKNVAGSLKWGQPSYEAVSPKTGSPVRIDRVKNSETKYAMYFICTTTLVQDIRERYPDEFTFEKNRALIFDVTQALPTEPLKHCIAMALTYKLGSGPIN